MNTKGNNESNNDLEEKNGSAFKGFWIWLLIVPTWGVLAALFGIVFMGASLTAAVAFGFIAMVGLIVVSTVSSIWEKLSEKQRDTVYKVVGIVGAIAFVLWVTWSLGRAS